jgi:hypothetical protein
MWTAGISANEPPHRAENGDQRRGQSRRRRLRLRPLREQAAVTAVPIAATVGGNVGSACLRTSSELTRTVGDVLELDRAEISDLEIRAAAYLATGVLGKKDGSRLREAFEPRG